MTKIDLTGGTTVNGVTVSRLPPAGLSLAEISLTGDLYATDLSGATVADTFDLFATDPSPLLEHNFDSQGILAFSNLDASAPPGDAAVRVVSESPGLKSLDHERIPLTAARTIGDLIDVHGLYRDAFLARIELPPHTASSLLTDIVDDQLGTSGNGDPEFTVMLRMARRSTSISVTCRAAHSVLSPIASKRRPPMLPTTFPRRTSAIITNADGSLTLVDKTAAADPTPADFRWLRSRTGMGRLHGRRQARSDRGGRRTGRSGRWGPEFVIDVADPRPNLLHVAANALPAYCRLTRSTVAHHCAPSYDASESTFSFTLDITKTFAAGSDNLALFNLGPLTGLVTTSTVDLLHPTVTLHLPFELVLTSLGFTTPLSTGTNLSDLNLGAGVSVVEGADDIRVHLANGTTFAVDLDPGLAATTLTSLNQGSGVRTLGDPTATSV